MNKKIIKFTVITALTLPLSSFAGDSEPKTPYGRVYGQLEFGKAYMNVDKNSFSGYNADKKRASGAIRVGYEFPSNNNLYFGLEAGVQHLGEYRLYKNGSSLKLSQGAIDLLMVVRKDINPRFSVFAKGGIAAALQDASYDNFYTPYYDKVFGSYTLVQETSNQIRPELAAGVKYDFNQYLAIVGTVNHIFADKFNANAKRLPYVSTTAASIGLRVSVG